MSGVSPSLNTNPNAKGGSFNYDSRTGLGYGQTSNGGLGSDWSMGDALTSPKGEWDNDLPINNPDMEIVIGPDTTVKELAIAAGIIEKDEESISGIEAGINSKANTSLHMPTVDFAAKKKRNPNSYVGLANTSAYLGASHKRKGEVFLENYIREILLEKTALGARPSLSGTIGDPYKPGNQNVTGGTHGGIGGTRGAEDHDGYTQKGVALNKNLSPIVNTPKSPFHPAVLKGDTDGSVYTSLSLNVSVEESGQDDDIICYGGDDLSSHRSSAEIMTDYLNDETKNVNRHNHYDKF